MRRAWFKRTLGIAVAIAAAGLSSLAQAGILDDVLSRGTIRIAVIGGNPPYSAITPSGEPEGYESISARRLRRR